jgi:hypothetical protein
MTTTRGFAPFAKTGIVAGSCRKPTAAALQPAVALGNSRKPA